MKARFEQGDAASAMLVADGIMKGQNTIARVPNDATKMRTIMMYTAPEIIIVFGP